MVVIKGLQKLTLIDYAPYTACMVFLPGCPFRCKFCHNPDLVKNHHALSTISEEAFFSFLSSRKGWLDGVCISGGEPTIQPDLPRFAARIKSMGFKVKLDTMGINPSVVKEMLDSKSIDYIAMDVKTCLECYKIVVQRDVDMQRIMETINLIRGSGIDYEFRTTVVPGLIGKDELVMIAQHLSGSKRFFIQNFRSASRVMDPAFDGLPGYSLLELEEMKKAVSPYFSEVLVR